MSLSVKFPASICSAVDALTALEVDVVLPLGLTTFLIVIITNDLYGFFTGDNNFHGENNNYRVLRQLIASAVREKQLIAR